MCRYPAQLAVEHRHPVGSGEGDAVEFLAGYGIKQLALHPDFRDPRAGCVDPQVDPSAGRAVTWRADERSERVGVPR
jgi:hypothetical protein